MPTFTATILLARKTATGIEVPASAIDELGAGRKPAVVVEIRGYTYRATVGVMGGVSLIPLSSEHRSASGLAAGDEVDVTLTLDDQPRAVDTPADFAALLDGDPALRSAFDGLSNSRQRALVDPISQAKAADTRQRRIDKAIEALRG